MRRLYLAFAFFILLVVTAIAWAATGDTLNTVPSSNLSFLSHLQTFLKEEDADRFIEMGGTDFIVSGGIHGSGAGLTKTPSAVVAYMRGMRTTESASVTYEDNTVCNLALHKDITGNIGTYTRVANTHYLLDCDSGGSAPDVVGVLKLLTVTTSGGAVGSIQDDREAGFTTDVPAITTSNGKFVNIGGTFNLAGLLTAVKINVIDTLSNAASRLLSLQVADVEKFYVTKEGDVYGASYNSTVACAAFYTAVRSQCMDTDGLMSALRTVTADDASYVTVSVNANAKIALVYVTAFIQQDGTGEAATVAACAVPGDSAATACSVIEGAVTARAHLANEADQQNAVVIVRTDASGDIKVRCDFTGAGAITSGNCGWYLVGYIL